MTRKRRGKLDEHLINSEIIPKPLICGGDDFDLCVKQFLDDLEIRNLANYTIRWYKDNLHCVKLAFEKLKLPVEPINLTEKHIKECILYWKKECNHSPTTINHKIRSLKQFFVFLVSEGIVYKNPMDNLKILKTSKVIIQPFNENELK